MRKIGTQIKYYIRKDKSSFISFGIIILVTAFMLSSAMSLYFQVDKAYDSKADALCTAELNFCIPEARYSAGIIDELKSIDGVVFAENRDAVFTKAVVKDFNGADFDMNTLFYNLNDERNLNRLEITEKSDRKLENPVYVPFYVSAFGGFGIGSEIVYEINGKPYTFTVTGIAEEMQYGNYGSGLIGAYLPDDEYENFCEGQKDNEVVEYSLSVREGVSLDTVKNEISSLMEDKGIIILSITDSESVKGTRTMVCDLLILILIAFAFIILAVSVFLSCFRIRNSIESETVNMSVLKALGYTGNQIVASITLPYIGVAMVFALLGVLCSNAFLPVLSQVLTMQSGFSFTPSFDVRSLACAVAVLTGIVALFTIVSAGKIRKLQTIDGLRGNSTSKGTKKNPFPLAESKGSIHYLLLIKQIFACKKQNVLLFLVSFVLTVLVAFSGTMFYNVVVKPDNFLSTLSEETSDIVVTPAEKYQSELKAELEKNTAVKKTLQYTVSGAKIKDKAVTVFACVDFSEVTNDLCYLGKNPEKENEIALGSAFQESYSLGDTVNLSSGENSQSFKVTGFIQSINYQGEVCELTTEGYTALGVDQPMSLYVYLNEGTDAEEFIKAFEKDNSDKTEGIVNAQKMQKATRDMYTGITVVLVAVIFVITVLIVLFILYIVIKSLLVKRRQELGIYKAIGYSNLQLMMQTVGSFMPVTAVAVLLSSALALVYMPCINQVIFEAVGAMKNNMEISFSFLMIFGFIQIIMNLVISIIMSMPIRKISAYSLIKE